jgi:hypothetical protein
LRPQGGGLHFVAARSHRVGQQTARGFCLPWLSSSQLARASPRNGVLFGQPSGRDHIGTSAWVVEEQDASRDEWRLRTGR